MTEENKIVEEPGSGNTNLRCGYLVGITEGADGALIFRPIGSGLGMIELLGLHGYAGHRLKGVLDMNQGTGDVLTAKILQLLEINLPTETVDAGDEKGDK